MNTKHMMIALLVLGTVFAATPSASAHYEQCIEDQYVTVPAGTGYHLHEDGCDDPETLLAFFEMNYLA